MDSSRAGCLPEMSAGIWASASRFRSYFLRMLKANKILRCRNLHVFGLPNESGIYGSVCCDSVHQMLLHHMFFLCQARKICRDQYLASQSIRSPVPTLNPSSLISVPSHQLTWCRHELLSVSGSLLEPCIDAREAQMQSVAKS